MLEIDFNVLAAFLNNCPQYGDRETKVTVFSDKDRLRLVCETKNKTCEVTFYGNGTSQIQQSESFNISKNTEASFEKDSFY